MKINIKAVSVFCLVLCLICVLLARPMLALLNTKDELIDGIPSSDWMTYIGTAAPAYLNDYSRMQLQHTKISLSFSALLFGPFYFFYRKAWKPAFAFLAAELLLFVPTLLQMMQITDVINGAVCRANRTTIPQPSGAKAEIIDYIRMRSKLRLTQSTTLGTRKFNIFVWEGRNA